MTTDFAITDCLVEKDGKFLVIQEGKPGREGLFNLPGGHIDDDETIFTAAIREVKEESGYDVELTGFLGLYQAVYTKKNLNVGGPIFLAKVVGGEAAPSIEHPEVRWVTADEFLAMAERGEFWTKYPPILMRDYLARGAYPLKAVSCERY